MSLEDCRELIFYTRQLISQVSRLVEKYRLPITEQLTVSVRSLNGVNRAVEKLKRPAGLIVNAIENTSSQLGISDFVDKNGISEQLNTHEYRNTVIDQQRHIPNYRLEHFSVVEAQLAHREQMIREHFNYLEEQQQRTKLESSTAATTRANTFTLP
eukprot:UN04725